MAYTSHTQTLNEKQGLGLADQLRITHPDSIVITLGGEIMHYALFLERMNDDDVDQSYLPLVILNPNELTKDGFWRVFNSGVYKQAFINVTQPLVPDLDTAKLYDEAAEKLIDNDSLALDMQDAREIHANSANGYDHIAELYAKADRLDDETLNEGIEPEKLRALRTDQALLEHMLRPINQSNPPAEILDDIKRSRVETHIRRRFAQLPEYMQQFAIRSGVLFSNLPLNAAIEVQDNGVHVSNGFYSRLTNTILTLRDVTYPVLFEETTHFIDDTLGFSRSKTFLEAISKEPEENLMRFERLVEILLRSVAIDSEGNAYLHSGKRPIFSADGNDYLHRSNGNTNAIAAELLANIAHFTADYPLHDIQRKLFKAEGVPLTHDTCKDSEILCAEVAKTIPHMWSAYKGLAGEMGFDDAARKQLEKLPPLPEKSLGRAA